jgi:hypothetical protein
MKFVLFVALLFINVSSFAAQPPLSEIRALYENSVANESACNKLIQILSPYDESNYPLYAGYKASAIMMMANHVINPFSKFSYFKKGKKILENAIKADGKNIELIFLRFNIQTHLPSFLGYDESIKSDRVFLENSFLKIEDEQLKQFLIPYLKNSDYINSDKKKQMGL